MHSDTAHPLMLVKNTSQNKSTNLRTKRSIENVKKWFNNLKIKGFMNHEKHQHMNLSINHGHKDEDKSNHQTTEGPENDGSSTTTTSGFLRHKH